VRAGRELAVGGARRERAKGEARGREDRAAENREPQAHCLTNVFRARAGEWARAGVGT
jgi:hypothetical protein